VRSLAADKNSSAGIDVRIKYRFSDTKLIEIAAPLGPPANLALAPALKALFVRPYLRHA